MRHSFKSVGPFMPVLAIALLAACSRESPTRPSVSETEALLTGAKWKLSSHGIVPAIDWDGNGKMVTDLYAANGKCIHDDIATYSPDHTFAIDEGTEKCHPSDPQEEKGRWSLDADGVTLTLDYEIDPEPVVMGVAGISASKLILTRTQIWPEDGKSHTETLTFAVR